MLGSGNVNMTWRTPRQGWLRGIGGGEGVIKGQLDWADNQFGGNNGFRAFWGVVWSMELRESVSLHILCAWKIGDHEIKTGKDKCPTGLTGVSDVWHLPNIQGSCSV